MKSTNRFILSLCFLVASVAAFAQDEPDPGMQTVLDGAYVREHNLTRRVIGYPHLREADVMWCKRVWEVIDVRQKINQSLYYPMESLESRKNLFEIIKIGLKQGSIVAYGDGPVGEADEFRYELSPEVVDSVLSPKKTVYIESLTSDEKVPTEVPAPVKPEDIVAYKLKEDWLFDKQRSERYVRIIGIAPVILKYAEDGSVKGKKDLFWLYYPECRYVFNNYDVFNPHNGAQEMTFDQLFQMRMFSGYIVKEDNTFNRIIDEYAKGIDALLESERIKNDLFIMEHDLWHY